jgi:crotonobetainyl-CoA:carnitine CoA-transferase CaiB-like acyl-CoA transferase
VHPDYPGSYGRRTVVADFSRILAGPYAIMLLADMGAEVIKVEGPAGDDTRTWMPPVRDKVSTYFLGINRGKRSIALDLRDESDQAAARELARRADIVIENFKPGGMTRFGLDYDTVRRSNPGVIYASISGFGSGPGRDPDLVAATCGERAGEGLTGDDEAFPGPGSAGRLQERVGGLASLLDAAHQDR